MRGLFRRRRANAVAETDTPPDLDRLEATLNREVLADKRHLRLLQEVGEKVAEIAARIESDPDPLIRPTIPHVNRKTKGTYRD
jgi:hypothetical protein